MEKSEFPAMTAARLNRTKNIFRFYIEFIIVTDHVDILHISCSEFSKAIIHNVK